MINPFQAMMENAKVKVSFIDVLILSEEATLQKQIMVQLLSFYKEKKIGHTNNSQKELLMKNTHQICSTMCFLHRHWTKLVGKELPEYKSTTCALMRLLVNCKRRCISGEKYDHHGYAQP
jgi:hypothetical protein